MKLILQQLPTTLKGTARMPFLAPDAVQALLAVERDTDGLVYTDLWRDPVASLLARRTRRTSQLPGYSAHNFGLAVDLDVRLVLEKKKILYEDLLRFMCKRGWFCHRRDGEDGKPEHEHFNFLGEKSEKYLAKTTLDPASWQNAAELAIWDRYGAHFQMETKEVQERLSTIGLFAGPFTGQRDSYTREAILAFQRAWDLTQSGAPDMTLCRVLAFVTAEVERIQLPSWAV